MTYEPLRGQRPVTNFSVPLNGLKRPGSPLRQSFTPPAEPTIFEDVFVPLDDDELPAKYKSSEMRKASVSVHRRRRMSQLEPIQTMQTPARNLLAWLPEVFWLLVSILCLIGK